MAGKKRPGPQRKRVAKPTPKTPAKRPGMATFDLGVDAKEMLVAIARARTVDAGGDLVSQADVLRDLVAREFAKLERRKK